MPNNIHKTAIISKKAEISSNVTIGPFCSIGPNVKIEKDCLLLSHVTIQGDTTIGKKCEFYPFSVIGMNPQDLKYKGEKTKLKIGDKNIFREHCSVHIGTDNGGGITKIGNDNLIMSSVHVAHDCQIGNNVILSHQVALAGHVEINDYAVLSAMVGVVQFRRIGSYSMVGGLCAVDSDILPFSMVTGNGGSRAFLDGVNIIGMRRRGFSKSEINEVQKIFDKIFNDKLTLQKRIERLEKSDSKVFKIINSFIKTPSKSGICFPLNNNE